MSFGRIIDLNCYVSFGPTFCIMQDHTGWKIRKGRKTHGLYQLEHLHLPSAQHRAAILSATSDIWHRRLGYPSEARL